MSNKTYHWGIIGLGHIAHKFAQDLATLPNAKLSAVASRSSERARAFGKQYGASRFYSSHEELAGDPDLDAVYIATEHTLHCENTLTCLKAGLPVLCEKPLGMNLVEVDKMIATAQENQVFFMEALWTRFMPITLHLLELIEANTIGEVFSLTADFGFKAPFDENRRLFNKILGGGSLLDIGIYPVFLANLLFGKPSTIKAVAQLGSTGVDEETGMVFQFEGGQMAHLLSTFRASTPCEATLFGTKGRITLHTRWHEGEAMTIHHYESNQKETRNLPLGCIGYRYEAEHLMQCLDQGVTESPLMPHAFSRLLMETLDAVRSEAGIHYFN